MDYAIDKCKTEGDIEVISFTKGMPYILDLTFLICIWTNKQQINGNTISNIIKTLKLLYIMGISESSLTTITKPFHFDNIAKYHATVHVVRHYVEKITIVFLISIHTKMSTAIVVKILRNR